MKKNPRRRRSFSLVLIKKQPNRSKGTQRLIYLTLFSGLGVIMQLLNSLNPFASFTKRLDSNPPVPICMVVERPVSFMLIRSTIPRSFSTGNLILEKERSLPTVVHVAPKQEDRQLEPVPPISEGSSFSNSDSWVTEHSNSQLTASANLRATLSSSHSSHSWVTEHSNSQLTTNNVESQENVETGRCSTISTTLSEWCHEISNDTVAEKVIKLNEESGRKGKKNFLINRVPNELLVKVTRLLGYGKNSDQPLEEREPKNYLKQLQLGHDRILVFEKLPRTPFAENEKISRTPRGELLPRTPTVFQNIATFNQTFTNNNVATNTEPSILQQVDQKSTIEVISGKNKAARFIAGSVGPNDLVRVNMGDKGLNNVNTLLADYSIRTFFVTSVQKAYQEPVRDKNNVEYSHIFPSRGHQHQFTSYEHGAVIASPIEKHRLKTTARKQQEKYEVSVDNPTPRLLISNDATMLEASLVRQLLDINVLKTMSPEILEQCGVTLEESLYATRYGHAIDRVAIVGAQNVLGLRSSTEHFDFYRASVVSAACNNCNVDLCRLVVDKSPADLQNPKFIETVYDVLSYNRSAKIFNESLCSLFEPTSNIHRALTKTGFEVKFHLQNLITALENKGIDIKILHKYNPDLENGGIVSFSEESLVQRSYLPSELCKTKEGMDILARELKADMVYKQIHRVLPSTKDLKEQTTLFTIASSSKDLAIAAVEEASLSSTTSPGEEVKSSSPAKGSKPKKQFEGVRLKRKFSVKLQKPKK